MSWKRHISFLLLTVAVPVIGKAEVNRSWESLAQTIKIGKSIVVIRMNAGQLEGTLLSINAEAITIEGGGPQLIRRQEVFRVRYANIRRRNTLIGLAIGAGAGAAMGATADDYRGVAATTMGLVGLGVGAALGGALPIGPPLYEAESVRRVQ
jgi:hypothetical protein